MGPTRNKKTYSKTVAAVPKTAEERRKRYKTRKVVPSFDQLFLKDDENKPKTPCKTKKGKSAKPGFLFEDSMADFQLPPPSTRKPLVSRNGFNSSYATRSQSSCSSLNENNDTFDKLFVNAGKVPGKPPNKTRKSRATVLAAKPNNSKSTSNSSNSYSNSSEMNDLYCSLLPNGASAEISARNFSGLMRKNRKTFKQQKPAVRNPQAKENISPSTLLDTLKLSEESSGVTSPCSSAPSSPVPQRRTTRTAQAKRITRDNRDNRRTRTTATIGKSATRNTYQDTGLKNSVVPTNQIPREGKSTAAVVVDIEADWSDEDYKIVAREESRKKLSRRRGRPVKGKASIQNVEKYYKVKFVEKTENLHENNHIIQNKSPGLQSSVKRLTVATPEDVDRLSIDRLSIHNSRASHNSLSDVVTSTPANQYTQRRIPSDGTPWGLQLAPMLEDETLSPVQRDSCIQAPFERSSVFESPCAFKSKCRGSTASESGMSPPYTTANEEFGIKTRTINEIELRSSLGTEFEDEKIPVFDPEDRVSCQFKTWKSSVEHQKQQSREIRRSKESKRESQNLRQKQVSIKEDRIESKLNASGYDDGSFLAENSLSNSIQTMNLNDQNEKSLSLMQISLSEILQNYNKKRRRCTIAKKITDHETTSELIKIGVLGTRTSLRFKANIGRQSTSNSPFIVPSSAMKSRQPRKEVQEVKKLLESLSLSKTEGSFIGIAENRFTESPPVHLNGHSSVASSLTDKSLVIPETILPRSKRISGDTRRSKRVSEDKKQINISTDQDLSQIITRPTRKRSSRIKSNISTDMEQSYSFNVNNSIGRTSQTESSSKFPVKKSLRSKSSSVKDRSRTNDSLNNTQSTLDGSSVLSTFTRQRCKRANKVIFTRPDTSVSDYSVMSIGDSVVSMQSVNELPVIKENSDSSDTASESNISNNYPTKDFCSEESEDENIDNKDTEEEDEEEDEDIEDNEDAKESDYAQEYETSENESSNCSYDPIEKEGRGEEFTENVSIEKDVSLYAEDEPSLRTPIKYSELSGFVDKDNSNASQNLSVMEDSNIYSQSKTDMSISESTEVIVKFGDLSLDKTDASMLEVDNSHNNNNSVSMLEVESTPKLKQKPVLDLNESSNKVNQSSNEVNKSSNNKQSLSMLELEDLYESLPLLKPGAKIPAKPGKGWRRSLSNNLLASFNESMGLENEVPNDSRRQTVHRISGSMVKEPVVDIHRLPVAFENKFHRRNSMVPLNNISRLSQRKSSYCCVRKSSIDVPSDPRDHVLQLCSQKEPLPLSHCFTQSRLSCCKKIGEGVYGEVFMSRPNPTSMDGATVLKIMPIEGDFEVNGEKQKPFNEIVSEIVISVELSNLRLSTKTTNWCDTYVNVLKCWCLEGQYLPELLTFWDNFHADKGSENDRPDMFPNHQLYIVLEFGHGGTDLEGYVFNNAAQSLAVFRQIVNSLAVAEQELEFEHRDLHWGNVLVAPTKESSTKFKVSGKDYTVKTQGVCSTIIDFTLSRLNAPNCVVYNNLGEDQDLFVAEGDYQFEIYRQMKITNNDNWESFNPYTNVLWLHYIIDKMINECYYKKITTNVHKTNLAILKTIKDRLLEYKSATDYVLKE